MRIAPIRSIEISFRGAKNEQQSKRKDTPLEEITVGKLHQEAQDRYVKERQAIYEAWDKNIHRPQKYQKVEGKVDDGKKKK